MTIRVRPDSPDPIYEQIAGQVVFAVAGGDLAPGDLVPSVRDLAVQLTVNPNTVTRAFQELERLGVIEAAARPRNVGHIRRAESLPGAPQRIDPRSASARPTREAASAGLATRTTSTS